VSILLVLLVILSVRILRFDVGNMLAGIPKGTHQDDAHGEDPLEGEAAET